MKRILVVGVLTTLVASSTAPGQAKDDVTLTEVIKRLEAVERENANLRGEVEHLRKEAGAFQTAELRALVQELVDKERVDVSPRDFRVYWDDGLRFESHNPDFKVKFGGRIMNDWAFFDTDDDVRAAFGDPEDGTEFRRARLYMSGAINESVLFKIQLDFAGGDADFKDVWIALKDVPLLGTVKVGHFKEPFSLEELTSSKYITFMERSLPNLFSPGRNTGAGFQTSLLDGSATVAAGIFRETDDFGEGFGSDHHLTGRATWTPIYDGEGETVLHTGVAFSHVSTRMVDFSSRPEAHLSEKFLDTGDVATSGADLIGLEAACVLGPVSVQGEYIVALVNPDFTGFYVLASYFLTGEHRAYKRSAGAFDRVKPNANYGGEEGGVGAVEVAARYSYVDLNSDAVAGGELSDYTFGVNWYLNPNARVMFNYVLADPSGLGNSHAFMMRFQVDF